MGVNRLNDGDQQVLFDPLSLRELHQLDDVQMDSTKSFLGGISVSAHYGDSSCGEAGEV